ncbi:hypothetical protein F7D13_15340 [Methylocystis rosea]|uniref:Zinc finger LSD1-type domain-containing protein n=1 Tax=Methylocystis rosea TaxID=173366 RepID=A0ABX6ENN0_9HYPH|nr:hypothetical protein F7D13_15340 [Methylocystis rosea]
MVRRSGSRRNIRCAICQADRP